MTAFRWTFWPSLTAKVGKLHTAPSFEAFARELTEAPELVKRREDAPGWSPGVFRGDQRADEACEALSALGLDYDKGTALDAVAQLWAPFRGFTHTTGRHTPEAPRCRVVLALSREVTPAEHATLTRWAYDRARAAGHVLDQVTKNCSRLWFVPAVTSREALERYTVRTLDGPPLDVDAVLAEVRGAATEKAPTRKAPTAPVRPARAPRTPPAERAERYRHAALQRAADAVRAAPEGGRNATLNREAFSLAGLVASGELDAAEAYGTLEAAALEAGLTPTETRRTLDSAIRAGEAKPRTVPEATPRRGYDTASPPRPEVRELAPDQALVPAPPAEDLDVPLPPDPDAPRGPASLESDPAARYSDVFNASRFATEYRDALRFSSDLGWLAWDGRRWARDGLRPFALAQDTARHIARDAAGDPDLRADEAARTVRSLLGSGAVGAMVNLARPHLAVSTGALDADPWALNVANGTVDLRTGQLRPHDPAALHTKLAPVAYDPRAACPQWEAFLVRILPDPEVRGFVQRLLGYACTGVVRDHVFPVFWGHGSNGKGTLVETVLAVLGDYARSIPPETLMMKHGEAHPTERASLLGVRFAAASETEENRRLNEALVKSLTGGDTISARFMRADFFEFKPTHKLALSTNHKPVVKGTDHGIWRRLRLVPFTVQIPEAEQDKALPEKLRAEASGVLAWLVAGCLAWQRDGLGEPDAVRATTAGYRNQMDLLGQFIADRCVVEHTAKGTATELYRAYGFWCGAHGERAISQRAFAEALLERGFDRGREGHASTRLWLGIGLVADAADAADAAFGIHSSSRHEADESQN